MKIDAIIFDAVNETRPRISPGVISIRFEVDEAWNVTDFAKAAAKIADEIAQLVVRNLLIMYNRDFVVGVFDVPVVQQRHHHLQTLIFVTTDKRILFPLPTVNTFDVLWSQTEAHVFKWLIDAINVNFRNQIVRVSKISGGPHQARCGRLAFRFFAKLDYPFASRAISHPVLRRIAALLFLN